MSNKKDVYFWIRVFVYSLENDATEKGKMVEELYEKNVEKEVIKENLRNIYGKNLKFRKPKSDGIYAIIMESSKFFYERDKPVDTICLNCLKEVRGRRSEFPMMDISNPHDVNSYVDFDSCNLDNYKEVAYFCNHTCKDEYYKKSKGYDTDLEFQEREKEVRNNKEIGGYIYELYNRRTNIYYVGQTKYLPFFRWQDHVKSKLKGQLTELTFRVLTEVCKEEDINNLEAWWIHQYKDEGKEVYNLVQPRFERKEWEDLYKQRLIAKGLISVDAAREESEKKGKKKTEKKKTKTVSSTRTKRTVSRKKPRKRKATTPNSAKKAMKKDSTSISTSKTKAK